MIQYKYRNLEILSFLAEVQCSRFIVSMLMDWKRVSSVYWM